MPKMQKTLQETDTFLFTDYLHMRCEDIESKKTQDGWAGEGHIKMGREGSEMEQSRVLGAGNQQQLHLRSRGHRETAETVQRCGSKQITNSNS